MHPPTRPHTQKKHIYNTDKRTDVVQEKKERRELRADQTDGEHWLTAYLEDSLEQLSSLLRGCLRAEYLKI